VGLLKEPSFIHQPPCLCRTISDSIKTSKTVQIEQKPSGLGSTAKQKQSKQNLLNKKQKKKLKTKKKPKILKLGGVASYLYGGRLVSLKFKRNSMDCKCTKLDWQLPTARTLLLVANFRILREFLSFGLRVSENKYQGRGQ